MENDLSTLADRLVETIEKDIKEIEQAQGVDPKVLRKECNILRSRIKNLEKFDDHLKSKVDILLKKLELLSNSN